MSACSDHRALIRRAKGAGCTVARSKRHIVITTAGGARVVASSSPSDVNAVHRLRRDLARAGVDL